MKLILLNGVCRTLSIIIPFNQERSRPRGRNRASRSKQSRGSERPHVDRKGSGSALGGRIIPIGRKRHDCCGPHVGESITFTVFRYYRKWRRNRQPAS